MNAEEKLEKLEKTLTELREDSRIKLVEGKKDRRALEFFDIKDIILIQNSSLGRLAERIKKEAILLTDFDRRGRIMTKRIIELFKNEGINTDITYRRELKKWSGLTKMEELTAKYHELFNRGDDNGKNLYRHCKICNICQHRY